MHETYDLLHEWRQRHAATATRFDPEGGLDLSRHPQRSRTGVPAANATPVERSSAELYAGHPDLMDTGSLIPTPNEIHEDDASLFDEGRDAGLIKVLRSGQFNTLDPPTPGSSDESRSE